MKTKIIALIDLLLDWRFHLLILIILFSATELQAYEFLTDNNSTVQVENIPLYDRGNCPDGYIEEVHNSFWTWDYPAYIAGYHDADEQDYKFTVGCADEILGEADAFTTSPGLNSVIVYLEEGYSIAAQTQVWFTDGGEIVEADITFATSVTKESSLRSFSLHEVGHALGLDHSDLIDSIMYFAVKEKNLHADDLGGFAVLYGKCSDVKVDLHFNAFLPSVTKQGVEGSYEGIVPKGGIWPNDAYNIRISRCEMR